MNYANFRVQVEPKIGDIHKFTKLSTHFAKLFHHLMGKFLLESYFFINCRLWEDGWPDLSQNLEFYTSY